MIAPCFGLTLPCPGLPILCSTQDASPASCEFPRCRATWLDNCFLRLGPSARISLGCRASLQRFPVTPTGAKSTCPLVPTFRSILLPEVSGAGTRKRWEWASLVFGLGKAGVAFNSAAHRLRAGPRAVAFHFRVGTTTGAGRLIT